MKIVIPGGSGFLGRTLARAFLAQGDQVTVLSRKAGGVAPWKTVLWTGADMNAWVEEIEGADVVLNLAGRSVNCRYTPEHRREILNSRVDSTRVLGQAISGASQPPRVWINSSTATIYRHSLDRAMDESGEIGGHEADAPKTWGFSIDVATAWEKTFFGCATPGTRKVALRSAMVMGPEMGGAFDQFCRLVRMGLGGNVGSGQQFVSWTHHLDFLRAIRFLIAREDLEGAVNVSSPNPRPYHEFMRAIRRACGAPFGLPAAGWILKVGALLWRTETELLLKSRRVVPGRLLDAGFEFLFPVWENAALDLAGQRGLAGRFGRFAGAARW